MTRIPQAAIPSRELIAEVEALNSQALARRIVEARKQRRTAGISQGRIALRARTSAAYVSILETLSGVPTPKATARYLQALSEELGAQGVAP